MEKPISSSELNSSIEFQDQKELAAPLLQKALNIQSGLEKAPKTREGKQKKLSLFADYFQTFESYIDLRLDDFMTPEKRLPGEKKDRESRKKRLIIILDDKRRAKAKTKGAFRGRIIWDNSFAEEFKGSKLVRDKMKDVIKADNSASAFHKAEDVEFFDALKNKLVEEVEEFSKAQTREEIMSEITDAQEVMLVLLEMSGVSMEQIRKIVQVRKPKSGGISSRRVLI